MSSEYGKQSVPFVLVTQT